MEDKLDKSVTKKIKGATVLLLFAHHLFAFRTRIYFQYKMNAVTYIEGIPSNYFWGVFGKICVAVFMFLGGYGLYKTLKKYNFVERVIKLFKKYWKNFLIFIPIGYIFFSNQGVYTVESKFSTTFDSFSLKKIIANFVGLEFNLNYEWGFLAYYIFAIFLGYIFISLMKNKKNVYIELFIVLIWFYLSNYAFSYIEKILGIKSYLFSNVFIDNAYLTVFLLGIIFSKYNLFNKFLGIFEKNTASEKTVISIIGIVSVMYIRFFYFDSSMDIVLVPIFIYFLIMIFDIFKCIGGLFEFLGDNSANMWLNHSFFCYYYGIFAKFVYQSENSVIAFFTLLILSLGFSIVTDAIWKFIYNIYSKISKREQILLKEKNNSI